MCTTLPIFAEGEISDKKLHGQFKPSLSDSKICDQLYNVASFQKISICLKKKKNSPITHDLLKKEGIFSSLELPRRTSPTINKNGTEAVLSATPAAAGGILFLPPS